LEQPHGQGGDLYGKSLKTGKSPIGFNTFQNCKLSAKYTPITFYKMPFFEG